MIAAQGQGWIGIDLGTHAVKLAQVERRGQSARLVEAMVIRRREPWPAGDGETPPLPSVAEIRAGLSLGSRFSGRRAAAVLSMSLCDVRGCQVPEDAGLEAGVLRELEAAFGDGAPSREFDFWSVHLPGEARQGTDNAIVCSLSADWSQRVADDLTESRLIGHTLDALPLTLARAVELGSPAASRTPVAAVDWGCRRATLCAVSGGRPLFVRCLRDAGFAPVIDALCASLSVTPEEAQKLLADHGVPNRREGADEELLGVIEEVIAVPLNAFIEEVNRTILFLRQQRRALAPNKVVLFGAGATVKNIAPYLSEKVEAPVELWQLAAGEAGRPERRMPIELLGPAIALSSLAWSKS
jgi:Tfp pilus assembly PilM family ATPase